MASICPENRIRIVPHACAAEHALKCMHRDGRLLVQWLEEFKEMVDRNADGVLSLAEITDMFHGARAREVEREIQLQPELVDLGVSDLRERAKRERVANSAIEKAAACDEPKMQLIRLICAAAEVEPLRRASDGASASSDGRSLLVVAGRWCDLPCPYRFFGLGSRKSSREIVAEKIRNEFYDKHWKALWEVLSYEVLDSGVSGTTRCLCPLLYHACVTCVGQHCRACDHHHPTRHALVPWNVSVFMS